jgi:hypothetical protein
MGLDNRVIITSPVGQGDHGPGLLETPAQSLSANMGSLLLCRGEYAASISHFQEALRIARELNDSISVSTWHRRTS